MKTEELISIVEKHFEAMITVVKSESDKQMIANTLRDLKKELKLASPSSNNTKVVK